jgi:hypothetical protein
MSRTAFLSISVCIILISALAAFTYKKGLKRIVQEFAILAASVLACFPLVFTCVRMVPAVINDPVIYDLEYHDEEWIISVGEPIYSEDYMTIDRFFTLLSGRFATEEESEGENEDESLLAFVGNDFANMYNLSIENTENTDNGESEKEKVDISNGRIKIFSAYIKNIGFKGHPKMGPIGDDDQEYAHAHNSYLQVFYNFGIIAGVIFLIICLLSLCKSAEMAVKNGRKYNIYFVPFAVIVVFGFVSLTEWAFHPCIPAGFGFLLMQVILIKD